MTTLNRVNVRTFDTVTGRQDWAAATILFISVRNYFYRRLEHQSYPSFSQTVTVYNLDT